MEAVSAEAIRFISMIKEEFEEILQEDPIAGRALLIAMYVRNNIEDFHAEHLSDAQMKELNPLIRNAIYTALTCVVALENPKKHSLPLVKAAQELMSLQAALLPNYWEPHEFTEDFWELYGEHSAPDEVWGKSRRPHTRASTLSAAAGALIQSSASCAD